MFRAAEHAICVCRQTCRVGFSELDQFEIVDAVGTTQFHTREKTDERVHGVGQGRATQDPQGLSRHAQLKYQQDSWSVFESLTYGMITTTTRLLTALSSDYIYDRTTTIDRVGRMSRP